MVDEIAHNNAPGSRHEKRWQDVHDLLDAGITVISTVNIQHLESLADIVETITGVTVRERIPDHIIDEADEVELVDMAPHALRQRMKHGNIYPPERAEQALRQFFREGNLTALRELALRRLSTKWRKTSRSTCGGTGSTPPGRPRSGCWSQRMRRPRSSHLLRRAWHSADGPQGAADEWWSGSSRPAGAAHRRRSVPSSQENLRSRRRPRRGGDAASGE